MMWWGMNGGWVVWMWIGGILIVLLIAAVIVLLVRTFSTTPPPQMPQGPQPPQISPARSILEQRLARGEITPDEFRELSRTLEEGTSG